MSKVDSSQLYVELTKKGLVLADNSPEYQNLNSPILVQCDKGHKFTTTLKSVRYASFVCPVCVGEKTKGFTEMPTDIPVKKGYRVVGVDNATYNMGLSIFDSGKLVYFKLLKFDSVNHVVRLNEIRDAFEHVVIPLWEPDFIQFEDIQHQNSYAAYEVLIKLVGLIEMAAERFHVEYDKVRANVWRSHFNINGKDRALQKAKSIKLVKEMYDIEVSDDVAEAILIAKYRADLRQKDQIKDLF